MNNDYEPQDSSSKIQQLPAFVQDAMASIENAAINREIAGKYGLTKEEIPVMVNIIARTILKEISLLDFPFVLKEVFQLDSATAKAMSLEIASRRFHPLKNHLTGVENLITKLGGEIPRDIPPADTIPDPKIPFQPPEPAPPARNASPARSDAGGPQKQLVQKDLRSLLNENKEAGEQLITAQPIQIDEIDQLVRPSLKNWLSDYIRLNGVGPNSLMVRMDYLYNSPNSKNLNNEERQMLAKILQSYDENIPLPVSSTTGFLSLEEIKKTFQQTKNQERAKEKFMEPSPLPPKSPIQKIPPAPPRPRPTPAQDEYLESSTAADKTKSKLRQPWPSQTSIPPPYQSQEKPYQEPPQGLRSHPQEEIHYESPYPNAPPAPAHPKPEPPPRSKYTTPSGSDQDRYLESTDNDLRPPKSQMPPTPKRPSPPASPTSLGGPDPRLSGNIIDLSDR